MKRFDAQTGTGELSHDRNVSHLRFIRDSTGGPVELVLSHRTHPDNEEKGVDVNLATYMMERACEKSYTTALLLSNDSDFAGVCRRVRARNLAVIMGYVDREYLDNEHLRCAVSRGYKISRASILRADWQRPK